MFTFGCQGKVFNTVFSPRENILRVIQKPKTMPYKMAASKGKRISGKHTEISRISRIAGRHGATRLGELAHIRLQGSVASCWILRYEITSD